ncbi:hypothetical protein V6N13_117119 [Hibiscus sabdariffa]
MHRRHLTNVEQMRCHLTLSDECSTFHNGAEDIDHVLRFCSKARELWVKLLEPNSLDHFFTSPFDDWLKENLRFKSHLTIPSFWCMRISIFCWLLWKARCCEVLGEDQAMCESRESNCGPRPL